MAHMSVAQARFSTMAWRCLFIFLCSMALVFAGASSYITLRGSPFSVYKYYLDCLSISCTIVSLVIVCNSA